METWRIQSDLKNINMVKEQLIKKLQELPDGVEVVVFDHRKNLDDDTGDGSSAGIYKEFEVGMHTSDEVADGCIPFAFIAFDNDDYSDHVGEG